MATTMETNLAVMKAVTGMLYTELLDTIGRHYPNMFDVKTWERDCALQGLGAQNNLMLYLTVINNMGVKDEFIKELMKVASQQQEGFGSSAGTVSTVACVDDYDLESDPTYMRSLACNTTRSCIFDLECEDGEDVGDDSNVTAVSDNTTQDQSKASEALDVLDVTSDPSVKDKEMDSPGQECPDSAEQGLETLTPASIAEEASEQGLETLTPASIIKIDIEERPKTVMDDDDDDDYR
ncbi:ATP-binding cassette, subfamily B (MDR/TAP), member 8 [Sarotherodon galilaeus]